MASAGEMDYTEKAVPAPTLALMYPKEFPYNPFQGLEAVAARRGLGVKKHLTDMQPQMGIRDWLLPRPTRRCNEPSNGRLLRRNGQRPVL